MSADTRPMGPERLAEIKALHSHREPPWGSIAHDAIADLLADRDHRAKQAEVCERVISDMSEAWDVLCGAVIETLDIDSERDQSIEDCEPDNARELAHALRASRVPS